MMATYFHGSSEIQANPAAGDNNLQTLYLMNPNYLAAYSEAHNHHNQTPPNMLLLNAAAPGGGLHHAPPSQQPGLQQQLIGIPIHGSHPDNPGRRDHASTDQAQAQAQQIPGSFHGLGISRVHYNLWGPTVDPNPTQPGHGDVEGQVGFRRSQGLSLSLSPGQQQNQGGGGGGGDVKMPVTVVAGGSTVTNGGQGVILGSKYLKAAQELLDEVVNVGDFSKAVMNNRDSSGAHKDKAKAVASGEGSSTGAGDGGGCSKKPAEQLSTAQRQELQMKKAKLLSMLDEVEQRYRQYHNQMQVVVSSFEQAAGIGSAKSYTSLALQTISRQFRCLKDSITSQIKATGKSLGEEDSNAGVVLGGKVEGGSGSRLRFVDHQLRQQRALQQLGMMQHNAWRPQRGLPERAVSVLRAWLFEHFLHPYPKDSDKHLLAKQTGLTRSQVSNWFINARVRLWKPMVEEMYLEEVQTQEQNGANSEDNANNGSTTPTNNDHNNKGPSTSKTTITPQQLEHTDLIQHPHQPDHHTTNDMISTMSAMSTTSSQGFALIGSPSDMESLMGRTPKKQRSGSDMGNSPSSILSMDVEMKPTDHHHHHHHNHPQINNKYDQQQQRNSPLMSNGSGFNPYLVHDMGRFNPDQLAQHHYGQGNSVSLTLGLPHCENLSLSGNHQHTLIPNQGMQLGRRVDIGGEADFCGISMAQPSHTSNGYDTIDIQNRTRFAAHQLLHDFVA